MLLSIIYQDADFIAINKPAGLLVHKSPIDKHETRFAIQLLRDQIGQYVFPIHRLDKPTSGILLFALNKDMASLTQQQFANNHVEKHYLAFCRGHTPDRLFIDHPVKTIHDNYSKTASTIEEKPAQTYLQTLARVELDFSVNKYPQSRYSLVRLQPITGRRHQLRAHLKHISHPLIGDVKYGKGEHNRFFKQQFANQRLLLAACKLRFYHPRLRRPITITSQPSDDFMQIIEQLNLSFSGL